MLARDAAYLLDRLYGAHLIVGVHDAHENGARRDGATNVVRVDAPGAIDGHDSHAVAEFAQEAAGCEDSRVLDGAGDDVIAPGPQRPGYALEGEVVGLAAPTREDDFVALTAEQCRHLAARLVRLPPWPPSPPNARSTDCRNDPRERAAWRRRPRDRSAYWRYSRDRSAAWSEHQQLVRLRGGRCQLVHGAAASAFHDLTVPDAARVHAGAAKQNAALGGRARA